MYLHVSGATHFPWWQVWLHFAVIWQMWFWRLYCKVLKITYGYHNELLRIFQLCFDLRPNHNHTQRAHYIHHECNHPREYMYHNPLPPFVQQNNLSNQVVLSKLSYLPTNSTWTKVRRWTNSIDTIGSTGGYRARICVIECFVERLVPSVLTNHRAIEVTDIRQSFLKV